MKAAIRLNQTSSSISDIFARIRERNDYHKPEQPRKVGKLRVKDLTKRAEMLLGSKFKLSEHTEKLFILIVEYINQTPDFQNRYYTEPTNNKKINFSFDKGLFFISPSGSGKSFIFENLLPGFNFHFPDFEYKQLTAYGLEDMFINNKKARAMLMNPPYNTNMYIDDLGVEASKLMDFGTTIPLIDIFVDTRVRLKRQYSAVTHGTSNLNLKELSLRYSKRAYSRFNELFNFITFDANIDFRML